MPCISRTTNDLNTVHVDGCVDGYVDGYVVGYANVMLMLTFLYSVCAFCNPPPT